MNGVMGSSQAAPVTQRQQHTHTPDVSRVKETEMHADTVSHYRAGWSAALLPPPHRTQSAAVVQVSKLSTCYLHTGTPRLTCGCVRGGSSCYCHLLDKSSGARMIL